MACLLFVVDLLTVAPGFSEGMTFEKESCVKPVSSVKFETATPGVINISDILGLNQDIDLSFELDTDHQLTSNQVYYIHDY